MFLFFQQIRTKRIREITERTAVCLQMLHFIEYFISINFL